MKQKNLKQLSEKEFLERLEKSRKQSKNGKGKAKIYVNDSVKALQEKAKSLEGYVTTFNQNSNIIKQIALDNPEIMNDYGEIYKVIS